MIGKELPYKRLAERTGPAVIKMDCPFKLVQAPLVLISNCCPNCTD